MIYEPCDNLLCFNSNINNTLTLVWMLNLCILFFDIFFGLAMFMSNVYRLTTKSEERARCWEKCVAIYACYNFVCFFVCLFSATIYIVARKSLIGCFLWFMLLGAQLIGRVYTGFKSYRVVSLIPRDPVTSTSNESTHIQSTTNLTNDSEQPEKSGTIVGHDAC